MMMMTYIKYVVFQILLSNDKNLCSKAIINGVKCIGLSELKGLLEDRQPESPDPDLQTSLKHCQATMYQLLANILEVRCL